MHVENLRVQNRQVLRGAITSEIEAQMNGHGDRGFGSDRRGDPQA
jgi:hypothetical protein